MAEYDNKVALGSSITQLVTLIKNALTGKQNTLTAGSGIDITNDVISSTGGGSSLPTDPSTDGDYVLQNTVSTDATTSEQTAELSWEKKLSAGAGIEINSENVVKQSDLLTNPRGFLIPAAYDNATTLDPYINLYDAPATQAQIEQVGEWLLQYGYVTGYWGSNSYTTTTFISNFITPIITYISNKITKYNFNMGSNAFLITDNDLNGNRIHTYYKDGNQQFGGAISKRLNDFSLKLVRSGDSYLALMIYDKSLKTIIPYQISYIPRDFTNGRYSPFSFLRTLFKSTNLYASNYSLGDVVDIMFQNINFSDLSSTETTPSTNNTIIWQYE